MVGCLVWLENNCVWRQSWKDILDKILSGPRFVLGNGWPWSGVCSGSRVESGLGTAEGWRTVGADGIDSS